jgi:hypothetical protein
MELRQLPRGRWFHDPALEIEGKVMAQNAASTTVVIHRPVTVEITDDYGNVVRRFQAQRGRPESRCQSWQVEPGRLPRRRETGP